jgi:diguanylate cyclase
LVALADLVGPVYRLALECSESRRRANVDGLTGLMTPIAFRSALSERIYKAERLTDRFALLFLDTDNFKACNDHLGHAAGDYVLKDLARILLDSAPPLTFFGRNGGDEFCLLLPLAKAEGIRCAEGIRRRVERHNFFVDNLNSVNFPSITVSIGVAAYPADGTQPAILLERADAAMYLSKRSGRNRVSYYDTTGHLVAFD